MDNTKEMIGTFSPQEESYTHEMPEETAPSGMFARGSYSAKTQAMNQLSNYCRIVFASDLFLLSAIFAKMDD